MNTLVQKGKTKRFRGRPGKRSDMKKAFVTLAEGQTIDLTHRLSLRRMTMALRSFNPVTASLRGTVLVHRSELWKGKPVKTLTEGKHGTGGRNNHGRITTRFRGGGHKQRLSLCRFQASQVRRAGDGRAAGIRSRTAPPSSR